MAEFKLGTVPSGGKQAGRKEAALSPEAVRRGCLEEVSPYLNWEGLAKSVSSGNVGGWGGDQWNGS